MILGMDTAGYYLEICKKYLEVCKKQIEASCFRLNERDAVTIMTYVEELHTCALIIEKIHIGRLTAEEIEKVEQWEAANIEYTQKWVPKE